MKRTIKRFEFASIFLTIFCFGLSLGVVGQNRVIITPAPTATPTPGASPTINPLVTPTPLAAPSPAVQSLPELQSKIRSILARPILMRGRIGLKVISLDTNKTVFEDSAEKYFMPASNMKSFTISTAMEKLTPTFRFVTSVYAGAVPDSNGVIRGDLTIYGRGDPSFSMAFTRPDATTVPAVEADYLKPLEALADKIVQAGVKKIEGNFIGDESYFNSGGIPGTWEVDDLPGYYGAEISALTINDNAIDVSVKPSAVGAAAIVQLMPGNSIMTVINRAVTAPAGTRRDIQIERKIGQNILEVSGSIAADDKGYLRSVAVSRPALYFTTLLRRVLEQKGVMITGQTRVVNAKEKTLTASGAKSAGALPNQPTAFSTSSPNSSANSFVNSGASQVEVARIESPVFSIIAAKTMKPSQNLYTELILRTIGEQVGDKSDPKKSSEDRGIEVVQSFLTQAGITPGSVVQHDGSGLSRHDLITPAASAQLYTYMNSRPYAAAWRESLTIAGIDGTLRNRFTGTPAAANVRGKTGTIDQVSALSGYVTTAAGEKLAFSILTNGIPEGRLRTSTIDEIVLLLTNFTGKSN